MESPFRNPDARFVVHGVAAAAVAGLLMGAAMRPNLQDQEIGGPQQLVGGGGPREAQAAMDPGLARYDGRIPEYVVGTDYLKAQQPPMMAELDEAPSPPEPEVAVYTSPDELPVRVTPAAWQDEPRAPTRYPSEAGNTPYESDLPAPPEAPDDSDLG